MATTQTTSQLYNAINVPNPNQPKGKVREIAERIYLENPFLPQAVLAKLLNVSTGRMGQICGPLEKQHEEAQKREIARLKAHYRLK